MYRIKKKMIITDDKIPKLLLVPEYFFENRAGTVRASVFAASLCSGSAKKIHKTKMPVTHPIATQIAAIPSE